MRLRRHGSPTNPELNLIDMMIKYISWMVFGVFCLATGKYLIRREEHKEKESENKNVDNPNPLESYKDFFISYLLVPLIIIIGILLFFVA